MGVKETGLRNKALREAAQELRGNNALLRAKGALARPKRTGAL